MQKARRLKPEERAGCDLKIRLKKEIYTAIVKEMAIKYKVA